MQIVQTTQITTTAIEHDLAGLPEGRRLLLARLAGEMGVKSSRTRRAFLRVLTENARRALRQAGVEATVRPEWSRFLVETTAPGLARQALSHVFGVHAVTEVVEVAYAGLGDLVSRLLPLFQPRVQGRTFAVRPHRTPGTPFTSEDLARALGSALLPSAARVDLSHPEVEVRVWAEPDRAFAEFDRAPGPGGLPLGCGGRALALVSGGFDSPVAAWHVMRRGVAIEVLVCDLGGCGQVDAALAAARELVRRWAPGHRVPAHVVDLAPLVAALVERVPGRMRQVLLKRAMYRVGDALAREIGAEALVTGECLGQVSTQTLRNLATCEAVCSLPVLRPLIGLDKNEIMDQARRIGTYEASSQVREHCSIAEGRVVTRAPVASAEAAERLLPQELAEEEWARRAAMARTIIPSLADWHPAALPEHVVEQVPDGAVVVDVREPEEGPPVGEFRLPFSRALDSLADLPQDRPYLLVCASGYRSDILARQLRDRGYTAFSLAGGIGRLRAALEGR
jgi:thiamine biosynthesis protein ThiI